MAIFSLIYVIVFAVLNYMILAGQIMTNQFNNYIQLWQNLIDDNLSRLNKFGKSK